MTWQAVRAEHGGIVTGWLLKIFLVAAVFAVVAYDAVSITMARVTASDDARSIAQATWDALVVDHLPPDKALLVGKERATEHGVMLGPRELVIAKDGTVTVHLQRSPNTIVAFRVPKLKDLTKVETVYTIAGSGR